MFIRLLARHVKATNILNRVYDDIYWTRMLWYVFAGKTRDHTSTYKTNTNAF